MMKKVKNNLIDKVQKEEVFVTDDFVAYRTEPPKEEGRSYTLFVKTRKGEVEISANTDHFLKMITGEEIGEEISAEGYYNFVHPKDIF